MKIEIEKPVVPEWFDEWYQNVPDDNYGYDCSKKEHAIQLISQTGWGNWFHQSMKLDDDDRVKFTIENVSYVSDNKMELIQAIMYGYEIEQPLYYAKIKGWEDEYFYGFGEKFRTPKVTRTCAFKLTKEVWGDELGINDTNADFEKVEE